MSEINSFEDLEVWKVCRNIRKLIYAITENFPGEEKYRLVDQLRRAAISATANIAEGFGRYHYQENIQFCRQSRGSLFEILDHLTACSDLGYISKEQFEDCQKEISKDVRLLNGYVRMLQRTKDSQVTSILRSHKSNV